MPKSLVNNKTITQLKFQKWIPIYLGYRCFKMIVYNLKNILCTDYNLNNWNLTPYFKLSFEVQKKLLAEFFIQSYA